MHKLCPCGRCGRLAPAQWSWLREYRLGKTLICSWERSQADGKWRHHVAPLWLTIEYRLFPRDVFRDTTPTASFSFDLSSKEV